MGVDMPSKHPFILYPSTPQDTSRNQIPNLFDGHPNFLGTPTHKSFSQGAWHGSVNATKKRVIDRLWVEQAYIAYVGDMKHPH